MGKIEFSTDRRVISTQNNGFAGNERDETLIDENLLETEIPLDDTSPTRYMKPKRPRGPSTTKRATATIRAENNTPWLP